MRRVLSFRHPRWLTTAYWLNEHPLAWECSVCAKLFAVSIDEGEHATDLLPPRYIESDFEVHSCELELEKRLPNTTDDAMRPTPCLSRRTLPPQGVVARQTAPLRARAPRQPYTFSNAAPILQLYTDASPPRG
jgi:hypothetical protein